MKPTWGTTLARRIGTGGEIHFTPTRVGMTLHVPCARGDHIVDVNVRPGLSPEGVAKAMLLKGWTFGSKLACPDHGRKERTTTPRDTQKKEPATMATAPANPAPQPSEAAKKAKRLVYQALEDYYDDAIKAYRKGHSDEKVATETGAAIEFVRQIRESDFGPLGQPSELVELMRDMNVLRVESMAAIAEYQRRAADISNRLVRICKDNGWPHPI